MRLTMESSDGEDRSNTPDESTRKTASDALSEEKTKLRKAIQELKELNFEIECSMNITKFGDIRHLLKSPEPALRPISRRIPDVETQEMDQLSKLAGMHCTKFTADEYLFSFNSSSGNFVGKDTYAVQIINISDEPKVGKWVMPMSVDMDIILSETPLVNLPDLKRFLANCKHYIDCYTRRVQQYDELQLMVNKLSGCWLDSSLGHTVVNLKFFYMEDLDSGESHNIMLYLVYESNRVWPHKIKIDPLDSKALPDATANKLKRYFKHFKYYDLKQAFEKMIEAEDTPVVWKKGEDQDALDLGDSSASSSEGNFITSQRRSKRKPGTRGKKRKAAETSLHSPDAENREQSSGDSDPGEAEDPRPSLSGAVSEKGKKLVKNKVKRRTPKKKEIEKSVSASKTAKKKPKNSPRKVLEPSANLSRSNLRQSTLRFRAERPEKEVPGQLDNLESIPERISTVATSSVKSKTKSNVTLLRNRKFGTSTPVTQRNRQKKIFANDTTEMSPIAPTTSNVELKKKQLPKKPG